MQWKNKIPAGSATDEMAAAFDLLPTIASLAGAKLPDRKIDGKDIWPLMAAKSGARSPHEFLCYYRGGGRLQAIRTAQYKLRFESKKIKGQNGRRNVFQLFDLKKDISESKDLSEQHPNIVERLHQKAVAFNKSLQAERRPEGSLKKRK